MPNVVVKVIDRLFLVAYGTRGPTTEEWDGYMATVRAHGVDRTMQLIFTDGGEPSASQRVELNELLGGRMVPVAVVSGSARVRVSVTALSWFNRKIKAFPPEAMREAIIYLEIPASRIDIIEHEMRQLRLDVTDSTRASA